MLKERGASFEYRDYKKDPLDEAELRALFKKLGVPPRDCLRKNDRAYRANRLTGEERASTLIGLMAEHPTLLQRPIGVAGEKAVVGRPPERLLELT